MRVILKNWHNVYTYILAILIFIIGSGRIESYAYSEILHCYANGGSWSWGTIYSDVYAYEEDDSNNSDIPYYLPSETPSRNGYTFLGYATNAGLGQLASTENFANALYNYRRGIPVTPYSETVWYQNYWGEWKSKNVTVDANGKVKAAGWSNAQSIGAILDQLRYPGQRVGQDTYAVWEKAPGFTVTFNVNGGSITIPSQLTREVTLPSPGTKTGYAFDGWYNGSTRVGGIGDKWTPTANATITAHWTPITYTITYELNGGKLDYKKVKYNIETPTFYIENPTKKGSNFTGWTGTDIETATTDLSVPLGSYGDKTFEATWGEGIYSISFDGNGATSGEMETLTVTAGEEIKLPESSFVRDGYSFVGWYTTKNDRFGTFYRNEATITDLTESVTLHAQWKKNKDTVEPGENGNGSGNSGSGNGDGSSTDDHGNGGNGSGTGDDTGNGNGSGNNGSGNGSGRGNDGNNKPVKTPEDEIGYFGTAFIRNEISIRTTNGMNDNKLTLNYNY